MRKGWPPAWGGYVTVDDVDAVVARVAGLGGRVLLAPTDIPTVGRFATIMDPQGATLSLITTPRGTRRAMKSRFSEAADPRFPAPAAAGTPVMELCWNHCISRSTFRAWKAKYGAAIGAEVGRLKQLERENARLRRALARATANRSSARSGAVLFSPDQQRGACRKSEAALRAVPGRRGNWVPMLPAASFDCECHRATSTGAGRSRRRDGPSRAGR